MPPPKDPIKYALWLQHNREGHIGKKLSDVTKQKMSRLRMGNKYNLGKTASEETRKKMSEAHIGNKNSLGHKASVETRKKMSESRKGKPKSIEWKQKIADAKTGIHHLTDKSKAKIAKARTELYSGENHPNWQGGISFEPYCPKFNNEFKERVRAFFDYTCPECGTPQNGKKLGVHHINFNKKACCDGTVPMFIPLCVSCHGKTQTRRDYWNQHFTDMINQYYGGKCYLTKEEYQTLQQSI